MVYQYQTGERAKAPSNSPYNPQLVEYYRNPAGHQLAVVTLSKMVSLAEQEKPEYVSAAVSFDKLLRRNFYHNYGMVHLQDYLCVSYAGQQEEVEGFRAETLDEMVDRLASHHGRNKIPFYRLNIHHQAFLNFVSESLSLTPGTLS